DASGPGDTPSRRRIFSCRPGFDGSDGSDGFDGSGALSAREGSAPASAERACAREILAQLARRAYRGADTEQDVETLIAFYEQGRAARGSFEGGIQLAIERLLASPKFTFRVEHEPSERMAGDAHPVSDLELASRLSFFLWSSIPDDELLDLAEGHRLSEPETLAAQVMRMLADPKARALVDDFAAQWLYLRNVASFVPSSVGFPDFDDNL